MNKNSAKGNTSEDFNQGKILFDDDDQESSNKV